MVVLVLCALNWNLTVGSAKVIERLEMNEMTLRQRKIEIKMKYLSCYVEENKQDP